MKRLLLLTVLGLILETGAFLTSNADDVPWLQALLVREYVDGQAALAALERGEELNPGDRGFAVVERELKLHLRNVKGNDSTLIDRAKLERLSYSMGSTRVGVGGQVAFLGARFTVDGKTAQLGDLDDRVLKQRLADLKSQVSFHWAAALFAAGFLLQIVGLVLEIRDHRGPHQPGAPTAADAKPTVATDGRPG